MRRGRMSDADDAFDVLYARGVTDGLPVIPPTAARVRAAVEASGRRGDEVIGLVAPRYGRATVEKIAINAVMAGCRPEYLPVVIAAVEAICDPAFALVGVSGTTDAVTPLVILNGPVRRALDVNCGAGVFGAGWRANATIGRALRLVWANVGGATPGLLSMSTFAQPGRYSYCIGEHEEASPWEPLHVEHGFAGRDSTVAVLAAEAPQVVVDASNRTARHVLTTIDHHRPLWRGDRQPHPGAARRHAARRRARACPHDCGRRLVEGRCARLPVGARACRGGRCARAEVPRPRLPEARRRRWHGGPLLGVGARLAVPGFAFEPGAEGDRRPALSADGACLNRTPSRRLAGSNLASSRTSRLV